jgi:hypothetical protein
MVYCVELCEYDESERYCRVYGAVGARRVEAEAI